MRVDGNAGSTASYEPNQVGEWAEQAEFAEPPQAVDGAMAHWNHRVDTDYFSQPVKVFRLFNEELRQALFSNTANSIGAATREIQMRHIRHRMQADQAYGLGVATALGISAAQLFAEENIKL